MKKQLTLVLLFICLLGFSQSGREKMHEQIKAEKIAYITEQLSLSEAEAQKFWPIYNKHEEVKLRVKSKYMRPMRKQMRENPNMSNNEANKMLENLILAENLMHEAKVTLVKDLKSAIPATKIIKLKSVEDAFNRKLLERIRKYRGRKSKD